MDELIYAELGRAGATPELAGAGIASVGTAIPNRVVTNEEVAQKAGVTPEWIVERTGVETRRVAEPTETLSAYAAHAAGEAISRAGIEGSEVDLVLAATVSHDYLIPSVSPLVAEAIGAQGAAAMDVGAACTGFVSALSLATGQIESGRSECAVVVGVDFLSRMADPTDRGTAALFGDGAGAVVLRRIPGPSRIGPTALGSDGSRAELIEIERSEGVIRMKGQDTYRHAVDRLSEATARAVELAGAGLDEVDLFAFHQANGRILSAVGDRLGLPSERVINAITYSGNTSAASIPMALAQADGAGRLKQGSKVLMAAFGGGLTWGATLVEWGVDDAS